MDWGYWEQAFKRLAKLPGVFLQTIDTPNYYIIHRDEDEHHDGVIDLTTGKLIHWTRIIPFKVVRPNEIIW